MTRLRQYLEKIQSNMGINHDQFLRNLPDKYRLQANLLFQTQLISSKPKRWIVKCSDEIFDELWELSGKPKNRIQASKQGDSHDCHVTANLLMVYHQGLTTRCPSVVYVSAHDFIQTFQSKPRLLLIENEENFIRYTDFCGVVSELMNQPISLINTDVALGGGNRATSKLLINWYSNYSEILCAFDYDLGGLKMFKTLKKDLSKKVIFVQPKQYSKLFKHFKNKPKSTKHLFEAIDLAKELGFTELGEAFYETRHFLEQEILLEENNV